MTVGEARSGAAQLTAIFEIPGEAFSPLGTAGQSARGEALADAEALAESEALADGEALAEAEALPDGEALADGEPLLVGLGAGVADALGTGAVVLAADTVGVGVELTASASATVALTVVSAQVGSAADLDNPVAEPPLVTTATSPAGELAAEPADPTQPVMSIAIVVVSTRNPVSPRRLPFMDNSVISTPRRRTTTVTEKTISPLI